MTNHRRPNPDWPDPLTDFRIHSRRESKGNEIRHNHVHLELHICEAGEGFIQVNKDVYPLAPGHITLIYGPALHHVYANPNKNYRRIVAIFPLALPALGLIGGITDILPILPTKEKPCLQFKVTRDRQEWLSRYLLRAHEKCVDWEKSSLHYISNVIGKIFLLLLHSSPSDIHPENTVSPNEKRVVDYVEKLITDHESPFMDVSRLSNLLEISPGHLWRIYTKVRGRSLRDFISLAKLSLAESNLRSGNTVTDAASSSFYTHIGTFSRTFKQHMGISPSMYQTWTQKVK